MKNNSTILFMVRSKELTNFEGSAFVYSVMIKQSKHKRWLFLNSLALPLQQFEQALLIALNLSGQIEFE